MATSAERAAAAAAAAEHRAQRLAAAEAAAAQAQQAAEAAAAAARNAAATAAALRRELVEEDPPRDRRPFPRRSPERERRQTRSPDRDQDRRRGRARGRSPVIQTVYKDSGASSTWPMLNKTNYHEWASIMKLKLQARQLWDAIEYQDLPYHEDRRTVEAIIAAVPQEMQMPLSEKGSAKEAWDSIAAARIGVDRVRRATLQRLRSDWEKLAFRPGEQIEDFTLRLMALKQQLLLHGDNDIDEERVGGEAPARRAAEVHPAPDRH